MRGINCALGMGCWGLLALAYGLEYVWGMEPCPLCVLQRLVIFVLGAVLLIGAWRPGVWIAVLSTLTALGGVGVAWRHLWLQSLPPESVPACGPGLDYLLGMFSLTDVLVRVLSGSGECAEVDKVFGVSIPLWTLLIFVGVGGVALWVNTRGQRAKGAEWG